MSDPEDPAMSGNESGGGLRGDVPPRKEQGDATDTAASPGPEATTAGESKDEPTSGADNPQAESQAESQAGDIKAGNAKRGRKRNLVTTLLSVFAVLIVVTTFGYFGGLGPLGRLSTMRELHAPAALGGLSRITDQQTRSRLELDRAADALAQNNEGETAVEAYGEVGSDTGLFVVIALRGKIDVDRTVADAGATADQVQRVGQNTCTTQSDDVVTCYRTSNTLTVMVRNSTGKAGIDQVAPMTDEAFKSFK